MIAEDRQRREIAWAYRALHAGDRMRTSSGVVSTAAAVQNAEQPSRGPISMNHAVATCHTTSKPICSLRARRWPRTVWGDGCADPRECERAPPCGRTKRRRAPGRRGESMPTTGRFHTRRFRAAQLGPARPWRRGPGRAQRRARTVRHSTARAAPSPPKSARSRPQSVAHCAHQQLQQLHPPPSPE